MAKDQKGESQETNPTNEADTGTKQLLEAILKGQESLTGRLDTIEEGLEDRLKKLESGSDQEELQKRLDALEQRKRKSAPASSDQVSELIKQNQELMARNDQLVGKVSTLEGNQKVLVQNHDTYSKDEIQKEIERQENQFDTSSKGKYAYWMTRVNIGEADDREIPMNYAAFEFRCDIAPDEIVKENIRVDGEPDFTREIITGNTKESIVSEYRKYSGEETATAKIRVEEASKAVRAAA